MATKDPKDNVPGKRDDLTNQGPNTSRNARVDVNPDPTRGGVAGRGLEPTPPQPPIQREPTIGGREPTFAEREPPFAERQPSMGERAQDLAREAREGVRQMADQAQHKASEVADRASHKARDVNEIAKRYADQADTFVKQQTDEHPWLMVFGAALAGYVVAGGLPRFAVRWVARFGLPIAATVALARYLSEENQRLHREGTMDVMVP